MGRELCKSKAACHYACRKEEAVWVPIIFS